LLKAIGKIIVALNGNVKKSQIAAGLAWGVLLGFIPAGNFFWIVLFLVSFFFSHNHWAKIFSMTILIILSPGFVYFTDFIGWEVLHFETFVPVFTTMYNMPFVPFTKFYNTLVMGGLVTGIVLWLPSFIIFMLIIPFYRNYIAPPIRNSKIVQAIAKSPFLKLIDQTFFR
jgi:uncharacterized protein (TIGR03546 family)